MPHFSGGAKIHPKLPQTDPLTAQSHMESTPADYLNALLLRGSYFIHIGFFYLIHYQIKIELGSGLASVRSWSHILYICIG